MDFLTLAKKRCTTRGFMEKEILSKDLEQILSAGRVAPTACNRQPQRIIVVRRRENMVKVEKRTEPLTLHAHSSSAGTGAEN